MRRASERLALWIWVTALVLPPAAWAGQAIKGIRHAHYAEENRTRLVLDCASRPTYSVATRSSHVVVTVLGAKIETRAEARISGLPERVRLETVSTGAAAVISFREPVQVSHFHEAPNSTYPNHRIVLDFRSRGLGREKPKQGKCVVVDPGHGGWNKGAAGRGRYAALVEKDIVLDVGRKLSALFEENDPQGTTKVYLTRTADVLPFIANGKPDQGPALSKQLPYRRKDLEGRVRFGEEKAAAYGRENTVFVSLHANWARNTAAHGFQVYIANDEAVARGEERRELEERENAGRKATTLDPRVARLIRSQSRERSALLARSLLRSLDTVEGMAPYGQNNGLHYANFAVLQTLDCPAALVEIAFLSNSQDARRLGSGLFRQEVARAVYNAVVSYFKQQDPGYPLPVLTAPRHMEYTVKAGDTLSSIASRFNTNYRSIMLLNGLKTATIYPGQVLKIPA